MLVLPFLIPLAACAPEGSGARAAGPVVELPPTSGSFDYQLGAAYLPEAGLDVVVRDAGAEPAAGAYNVCYVNGFQTQPDETDRWLGDNEELLLHDAAGELVVDPDWPGEYVLDPGTAERRERIVAVVGPVVTGCADAGYDAVEFDNLDTWTRFTEPAGGVVHRADALALAGEYLDLAHAAGLAVGQKNAAEATEPLRELGFDFAVTEECGAYGECGAYTRVYGGHVLQVEYTDNLPGGFREICALPERAPLTILRDRDLVGPGDAGYTLRRCPAP